MIWLYFDEEAKRSFHSIYRCLQNGSSEIWNFQFIPPNLNGWQLEVYGRWGDEQDFVADSIKAVGHPGFDFFRGVNFKHPRFKIPIAVSHKQGANGGKNHTPPDKDPELDIPAMPGSSKKLHRQHDKGFKFSIPHASTTSIDGKKSSQGGTKSGDKDSPKELTGVGHGQPAGKAQEFDYGVNRGENGKKEDELKEAPPTARFKLFEKAIESLVKHKGYEFDSIRCVSLPEPTNDNGAYKRTHNSQPASCHVATLSFYKTIFVIVEIDTESFLIKKSLSTLVASLSGEPKVSLLQILQACSEKGVAWDKGVIANYSVIFDNCRHPPRDIGKKADKDKDDKTDVAKSKEAEFLRSWVNHLNNTMNRCHQRILNRK